MVALAVLVSSPAAAIDLKLEGQLNQYAGLNPVLRPSAALTLEARPYARERGGTTHNLDVVLFGRYGEGVEEGRKHVDIREFGYIFANRHVEWRMGIGRAFWGVTESVHLVDIINQDDALEDIDGEDKLGQPWLAASTRLGPGKLGAFVLPRFRERQFSPVFRELAPFAIRADERRYESSREQQHVDYALRYGQRWGGLEARISYFNGTNREPLLLPCAARGSGRPGTQDQANCDLSEAFAPPSVDPLTGLLINTAALLNLGPSQDELEQEFIEDALADVVLIPHYDQIQQFGLEAQWVQGPAAWKFEGRWREQRSVDQIAFAGGVEWSLGVFWDGLLDIGLLAEYLYDDRDPDVFFNLFDDDIFLGSRILGNDIAGTQVLGGVIIDRNDGSWFWSLEASRRLNGRLLATIETRGYQPRGDAAVTDFLDNLDNLRLQLELFF